MKEEFLKSVFYDTVTVGERGQVVIPAKARKDFGIKAGDKLIVLRGMGKLGLVLIHTKHMSDIFSKLTKHIGKLKEILSK
ncbi:AbrB/MazE/SpoVT family DNA-binding domain-containing protein [Candidatus Saganbacteria bacterium]|nr:AbrB/MazE/SpoVT family DNA-binding domain-containing protein [Candidatus Saganbacteria bacterium]